MLNFTSRTSTDRGPGSRDGLPESAERATFAAGQPVPDSNFVPEEKSPAPQPV